MDFFKAINEIGIPKAFWYTISLCLIIVVLVLTYLAYRSQSVSIEINDAKIQLDGGISKIELAYEKLQEEDNRLQEEDKRLKSINAELTSKIEEFNNKSQITKIAIKPPVIERIATNQEIIAKPRINEAINNLKTVQESLNQQVLKR